MNIRPAIPSDFAAVRAIDTVARNDESRACQISKWIEDQFCHLVEIDGDVVAYGVLHYHFFNCGFIEMLMVGERFRRRGHGSTLINYLISSRNRPKLFTSTNRSNLPMLSLLDKAGFVGSGYIENLDVNDIELLFFWNG